MMTQAWKNFIAACVGAILATATAATAVTYTINGASCGTVVCSGGAYTFGTLALDTASGVVETLGNTTSTGIASPVALQMGGTFGNAGGITKLRIYNDAGGGTAGIGLSSGQLDYVSLASSGHAFYSSTTKTAMIGSTGKLSTYNSIATVSNGVPSELGTADLTGQTAAKTATTLYTPTATGMYRISIYLQVTTAGTTSILGGTTGVVLTYNDGDGNVAQSVTPALTSQAGAIITVASGNTGNTTTTSSQGSAIIYAQTGVAIQYAIGYSSTGTAMQYAAHLKAEAM